MSYPKATNQLAADESADTRQRILDGARRCFAEVGFESTSNRAIAERAGVSTASIYYYFDSKTDLFAAVYHAVQAQVTQRFELAADAEATFVGKLSALFDLAHTMNRDDRTLAVFIGSSAVDLRRHDSLRLAVTVPDRYGETGLYGRLVNDALSAGELDADQVEMIIALIKTINVGLTDAVSDDLALHRNAIEGVKALLNGTLINAK